MNYPISINFIPDWLKNGLKTISLPKKVVRQSNLKLFTFEVPNTTENRDLISKIQKKYNNNLPLLLKHVLDDHSLILNNRIISIFLTTGLAFGLYFIYEKISLSQTIGGSAIIIGMANIAKFVTSPIIKYLNRDKTKLITSNKDDIDIYNCVYSTPYITISDSIRVYLRASQHNALALKNKMEASWEQNGGDGSKGHCHMQFNNIGYTYSKHVHNNSYNDPWEYPGFDKYYDKIKP